MTTIEQHADAILRAAGSSLSSYTMPATRHAILDATEAAYEAGRKAGWTAFEELMMVQLGPYIPAIPEGAMSAPKIQHSEGE